MAASSHKTGSGGKATGGCPAACAPSRRGYTLLELQVAMVIMAVGLLGIGTLMIRQSRQVSRLEQWCSTNQTYYLVAQSDQWMRTLGAPAELSGTAGHVPWTPGVWKHEAYSVTVDAMSRPFGGSQIAADVSLLRRTGTDH